MRDTLSKLGQSNKLSHASVRILIAPDKFKGTLIFVSHDREFVSSLATRIIELKPAEKEGDPAIVVDYQGNYEDYLTSQGVV